MKTLRNKKFAKFLAFAMLIGLSFSLSSCLKDSDEVPPTQQQPPNQSFE
jgi:hypothetical protein